MRLDVDLSSFEEALLARHLSACTSCRSFADDLQAIGRILRETPPEPPKRRFSVPRRSRRFAPRVALAAATAAALAAVFAGPPSRNAPAWQTNAGIGAFDVDRDLRDLRREQLKPRPVHIPGLQSIDFL